MRRCADFLGGAADGHQTLRSLPETAGLITERSGFGGFLPEYPVKDLIARNTEARQLFV